MNIINIAAAIVLDKSGSMLVVRKRDTIYFMQPGGKIEFGESGYDTLVRELKEEIGSDVIEAKYIGKFSASAANEPDHIVEAEIFETILKTEATPAAEIAEISWLSQKMTPKIPIAPLTELLMKEIVVAKQSTIEI